MGISLYLRKDAPIRNAEPMSDSEDAEKYEEEWTELRRKAEKESPLTPPIDPS